MDEIRDYIQINMNKEVFALGISNLLAPFFSAFAGAGSFNRTQVNEDMQVTTPLAALLTGIFVAAIVFSIGELFFFVPTAVIAGVLFLVGSGIINWKKAFFLEGNLSSKIFFYTVALVVIFIGLAPAILLALSASIHTLIVKQFVHEYTTEVEQMKTKELNKSSKIVIQQNVHQQNEKEVSNKAKQRLKNKLKPSLAEIEV